MSYNICQSVKTFLRDNPKYTALYLLLSLNFPINQVLLPYYYGRVIENIPKSTPKNIWKTNQKIFIIIICLWILNQSMNIGLDKLDTYFIPHLSSYVRQNLVVVIIKSLKGKYRDPEVGELISQVIKLPYVIRDVFHQIRTFIVPAILVLTFAVGYLFFVEPSLGLIALCGIAIFVSILYLFSQKCFNVAKKTEIMGNCLNEEISDLFSNILNVLSFNQVEKELIRLEDIQEKHDKQYRKTLNCSANFKIMFNLAYFIFFIGISAYAFKLYSEKKIQVSQLSTVIIILLYVVNQMEILSNEIRDFVGNLGVIKNIQDEINKMEDIINQSDSSEVEEFTPTSGDIIIRNLVVKYPDFQLNIPSLQIDNKSKVSISGSIGNGKSTLVNVLLKYVSPDQGEIKIGMQDIQTVNKDSLRNYITYIPQQPRLFNRTIEENLLYGCHPEIDINRVKEIIQKLNLNQLSNIDLTRKAGKNGSNLSGGQRQLVYFLRFLLRKPTPIVILDEPTSALDSETRNSVMRIIDYLLKDRTALIITHDPEVVKRCNRHIMLEKGQIVEK